MKKRVELTLERINLLAQEMPGQDEFEKAHSFAAIKVLLDWLREANRDFNNDNAYASEKLINIEWSAAAIAGLDDGNGHDDMHHLSWVTGEIDSAGSDLALGAME